MPQIDIDGAASRLSADNIRGQSGSTITIVSGHNLVGSGSGLTALPAANLTGTIAAISGANLTNLPAANLTGTLPAISGANLTNLPSHSGNVAFPASQSASSNANTLDDYEEGDWTPVLTDGTNNATGHATYNVGKYTKIGNLVFISAYVDPTSMGSVSGGLRVAGLPFTSTTNQSTQGGVHINYGHYLSITQGESMTCYVQQGTTFMYIRLWDTTQGTTNLETNEFVESGTLGDMTLGGHYFV